MAVAVVYSCDKQPSGLATYFDLDDIMLAVFPEILMHHIPYLLHGGL